MSGGSFNYVCYKIEDLSGRMQDPELDDLMKDLSALTHDLEWATDGDIGWDDYSQTVRKFKKKWFKSSREARLMEYVDTEIDKCKHRLYNMISTETDDETEQTK